MFYLFACKAPYTDAYVPIHLFHTIYNRMFRRSALKIEHNHEYYMNLKVSVGGSLMHAYPTSPRKVALKYLGFSEMACVLQINWWDTIVAICQLEQSKHFRITSTSVRFNDPHNQFEHIAHKATIPAILSLQLYCSSTVIHMCSGICSH